MSKAVKQSIVILVILLLASLGFAGFSLLEKQKVEKENLQLQDQLTASQDREKKKIVEVNQLKGQLTDLKKEKDALDTKLKITQDEVQELLAKSDELVKDRDNWKGRLDSVQQERNRLLAKVKNFESQQNQNFARFVQPAPPPEPEVKEDDSQEKKEPRTDDKYWASLLKEKAGLEVQLDRLKSELSNSSVQIADLKQKNVNLQIELENLQSQRADIEQEIKYREDLVNNLSIELVRIKNDRTYVADKFEAAKKENVDLRDQIRQLVSTKSALEKKIVQLNDDKMEAQKKLIQTEHVVQNKIDEIWQMKDSLNKAFVPTKSFSKPDEIELPPIVVSSNGQAVDFDHGVSKAGVNGKVLSINEENNFVIVNVGENKGARLGDSLSIYRDDQYVGRAQIIQVRKEISAADLKDQWSKVRIGDAIR